MEKVVTRRKWTAGLLIAGTVVLVVAFWSLIMSMLSLLAVAGVLTLLSLPLCKMLEKRLPGGSAAAIALLTLLGAVLGMRWGLIPPLLRQSAQLMSRLPALLDIRYDADGIAPGPTLSAIRDAALARQAAPLHS